MSLTLPAYRRSYSRGESQPPGALFLFGITPKDMDDPGSVQEGAVFAVVLGDERPTYAWVPEEERWVLVNVIRVRG